MEQSEPTCGTHFGDTKLVVSMTGSPDAESMSIRWILASVGTMVCGPPQQYTHTHTKKNRGKMLACKRNIANIVWQGESTQKVCTCYRSQSYESHRVL